MGSSLDEMREDNKKTPPNKDVKDTCALVIRDNRRVRIEEVPDNIGNRAVLPSEDDEEDFINGYRGDYGRACATGLEEEGGRGIKNPSLPFHLNLYPFSDLGHTQTKHVVVVDEGGRATISRLGVDGRLGVVCD